MPTQDFERLLFHDVARLVVVVDTDDELVGDRLPREPRGWATGTPSCRWPSSRRFLGSGLIVQGAMLFVDECLASFDLRKIYLNLTEDSFARLGGALRQAAITEGVLRDHFQINGRRQDLVVAAITPASFVDGLRRSPLAQAHVAGRVDVPRPPRRPPSRRRSSRRPPPHLEELDERCAQGVGLEPGDLHDDLDLRADLHLDSMAMLEVLCLLDDLAGPRGADRGADGHGHRRRPPPPGPAPGRPTRPRRAVGHRVGMKALIPLDAFRAGDLGEICVSTGVPTGDRVVVRARYLPRWPLVALAGCALGHPGGLGPAGADRAGASRAPCPVPAKRSAGSAAADGSAGSVTLAVVVIGGAGAIWAASRIPEGLTAALAGWRWWWPPGSRWAPRCARPDPSWPGSIAPGQTVILDGVSPAFAAAQTNHRRP